jgi:pyruvate-formate lyase-activating enzyme
MEEREQQSTDLISEIAANSGVSRKNVERIVDYLSPGINKNGNDFSNQMYTYRDLLRYSIQLAKDQRTQLQKMDLSHLVPPIFPSHVQIQTVGGCNAACSMCPMNEEEIHRMQHGYMEHDLFIKLIDECVQYRDCEDISLYVQNEPLLDPNLAGRVKIVKERSAGRLNARIVTNGNILTPKRLDELLEAGIDEITVSLNAYTKSVYEQVMGLDFETTMKNVELLLKKAPPDLLVTMTFVVLSENEHEIEEAINYWSGRGVMCGAFGINTGSGRISAYHRTKSKSVPGWKKECYLPLVSTAILANGDMMLCSTDWERKSICGNVNNNSIYELWHAMPLMEIRRKAILEQFDHKFCSECLGQSRVEENLMYEGGPGGIISLQHSIAEIL